MVSKLKPIATTLLMLLICFSPNHTFAISKKRADYNDFLKNSISEEITITIPAFSGISIIIEHSFGDIDVRTGQNNRIYIEGEKRVSSRDEQLARKFLDEMELRIEEGKNEIIIKTHYPDVNLYKKILKKIKNYSISYTIEIPEDITLQLKNSFGNLDLNTVSGQFSITNSYGKVTANDLTGETELNNKFGSITSERINGGAIITNEHSSLNIKHVTGNLEAKTSFGSIDVYDVKGDAKITSSHGKITVEKIGGEADLITSFSTITSSDIEGKTTIRNSHGKVDVSAVQNDTDVTTSFGRVHAENIKGNVSIENQHASVNIAYIAGDAKVNTSFGTVNVNHVGGGVIVTNQQSSITVKDILSDNTDQKRHVKLKTSFGNIGVSLPEHVSAQLSASTSFGKIKCDFPILMNRTNLSTSSSSRQKISGAIGDGKDLIELEGSHTSISIEKL